MPFCMHLVKFILCSHNIMYNLKFVFFCNFLNLFLLRILSAHIYAYFVIVFEKQMGGNNITAHALVRSKKSALKRGKTYLFDAMNVLYSMSKMSFITDLLAQKPPIPTRQIVSCLCVLCFLLRLHVCVCWRKGVYLFRKVESDAQF